tara:strand:- start:119 stop:1102 length:984 start_codon:yes stop_codon:yes gene_type:complete
MLKKIILIFVSIIFAFPILIELKLRNFFKKKYYCYYNRFGWADSFCFYISLYNKIKNNNFYFALVWDHQKNDMCEFFFDPKKIIKTIIFIPRFIPSRIIEKLLNKFHSFPMTLNQKQKKEYYVSRNTNKVRDFLKKKINLKKNNNLFYLKKEKYVCFYFRYIKKAKGILRCSTNIKKCYSIIDYLLKNNYKVLLMGYENEEYLKHVRKQYPIAVKLNKVLFMKDLSPNHNFLDQLFAMQNSKFYCGTAAGFLSMFYFLKIKALSFDGYKEDAHNHNSLKLIKFLYKKKSVGHLKTEVNETDLKEKNIIKKTEENSTKEILESLKRYI